MERESDISHCMSKKQLSVKLRGELADRWETYHEDQNADNKASTARTLIDAGLRANGYVPEVEAQDARWLQLARGIGSVLGVTAIILLALGTYLPSFSGPGLGLATASIGFYAGAEIADRHGERIYDWLKGAAKEEASHWGLPKEDEGDR